MTSGLKVVLGLLLAVLLTSKIIARGYLRSVVFFPVLVSTIGSASPSLCDEPRAGSDQQRARHWSASGPGLANQPDLAIFSIALVDVWKGVGLATVIYIAGIVSIPADYYEAAQVDGASRELVRHITLPLARPATASVITLSLIGGLRSFDLIWAMTGGGPGFASDVIASVIYKQYQAGFYGLSTAGKRGAVPARHRHRRAADLVAQPWGGSHHEERPRHRHRIIAISARRSSSWCRSPSSSSPRRP